MTEPEIPVMDAGGCDVCGKEPSMGVGSVPGIPVSVAYGKECIKANAHPLSLLVANTAILGGLSETAEWWQQMVRDTLNHLGKTLPEFEAEVADEIREMAEEQARADAEFAATEEGGYSCMPLPVPPQDGGAV